MENNEEVLVCEEPFEILGDVRPIGVYVKKDTNGKVIEINSDIFIKDLTGWEKIDEGFGDKFAHAQSQYRI